MTGKTTSAQRDRERAVLAAVERFAPLRRLGWAFLLAWVFCVFYTNAVSGYTGAKASTLAVGAGWDLFFTGLPVSMSVVMLALIVVLAKRAGSQQPLPDERQRASALAYQRLSQLDDLYKRGAITEEEYALKKQECMRDL